MQDWLKKHWFRVGLLLCLILLAISIDGYVGFLHTREAQETFEKQRELDQIQKEYVAKRKSDCLDIYKTEGAKWNNVSSWNYDESNDSCDVIYKQRESERLSQAKCTENLKASKEIYGDEPLPPYILKDYAHCVDGTFANNF